MRYVSKVRDYPIDGVNTPNYAEEETLRGLNEIPVHVMGSADRLLVLPTDLNGASLHFGLQTLRDSL